MPMPMIVNRPISAFGLIRDALETFACGVEDMIRDDPSTPDEERNRLLMAAGSVRAAIELLKDVEADRAKRHSPSLKCSQVDCHIPAIASFLWPGQFVRSFVCPDHLSQARLVASTLGFSLDERSIP